jgi:hypothetical protein
MRVNRTFFLLIGLTLLPALTSGQSGSPILFDSVERGWGCGIMGVGIVSSLNPFNVRQVESLYESAQTDLRSAHLTSLLSEAYGFQGQALRNSTEFAIYDDRFDDIILSDSLVTHRLTVIKIERSDVIHMTGITQCDDFLRAVGTSEPVKYNGYWVTPGSARYSRNAPFTSYQNARKQALTTLGEYLGVEIQNMERRLDSGYASITYQKTGVVFELIVLTRLRISENEIEVVLAIPESHIRQIR